jgi:site-specific DNA recombinase
MTDEPGREGPSGAGRARAQWISVGGKCYGYRNVPIEDPTRSGKYGRFAVSSVQLEIIEEEAALVRRIFQMYADGISQATIAKALNKALMQ